MSKEIIITGRHIHLAVAQGGGFCVHGMREWFKLHGLDFHKFIREGYPISIAEGIDDKFAKQIVAIARAEAEKEGTAQ